MKSRKYFQKLLANNNVGQLIKEVLELLDGTEQVEQYDNFLLLSSRFKRNEEKLRKGIMSDSSYNLELNRITSAVKDYLNSLHFSTSNQTNMETMNSIFISYNHKDKEVASKIRKKLEEEFDLEVRIDTESLKAGEDIKEFIERAIRETDVTLSIVSINSLMSSWVALESIQTFAAQKVISKKFIAGFIDNSFFSHDFIDSALDKVEDEVINIKTRIKKRLDKNRNINDLQTELERYNSLVFNLPKIIDRLKTSLSVDISEKNFDIGIAKIVDSIIN